MRGKPNPAAKQKAPPTQHATNGSSPAAPAVAEKPLGERVKDYEARLVGDRLCQAGELQSMLKDKGVPVKEGAQA